ncbi:MAG: secretin N-terminal domain-containing protein [Methylotenera sp.]
MKRHLLRRLYGLTQFLFVISLSLNAWAVTDFKIITLQHRFVEDILPIIQPLAGDDGAITGMQNHLIIRASPEKMAEIEQIISTLDVARSNLKITVSRQNNLETSRNGVDVNGRKRIGNVAIETSRYPRRASDGVQIGIENNRSVSHNHSNQFINVIDGGFAYIQVGQSIPFTQEWVTLTRRYASIQRTTDFVEISTGFAVHPRSIGSQIELEITPRIAQFNQQGYIDFDELRTVVLINKGEWFNLAATMQQKDEVSRAILSTQNSKQTQDNALSIRIDE